MQINLTATLTAYSKVSFYGDYVRKPSATVDNYDQTLPYLLVDDKWTPIDLDVFDIPVDELQSAIESVSAYIDYDTNTLKFVDSNHKVHTYLLPASITDNTTIGLDKNQALTLLDKYDSDTLQVVDEKYETIIDDDGLEIRKKISGRLRVTGIVDVDQDKAYSGTQLVSSIRKLQSDVDELTGRGGYLHPENLGNISILSEVERNTKLTAEAINQGKTIPLEDQTKIKNLFDGHIWVYTSQTNSWLDEGADTIVAANNDGVLGAVTGVKYNPADSTTKYKISIETDTNGISTGVMSVNGLNEEFEKVVYTDVTAVQPVANSVVTRTHNGTVKSNVSVEDDDVVTRGEVSAVLGAASITNEQINELFRTLTGGVI